MLGDHQEAIADCNMAIDLIPKYAMAYYVRGTVRRSAGDEEGAMKDFAKARKIDPRLHPPDS